MQFNPLVADTHQPEAKTEQPGPEHGFVISTQCMGSAKIFNAAGYRMEQGSCRFIRYHCKGEIGSRTVIQYAEDSVQLALVIGLAGEIQAPDSVLVSGRQFPTIERSANDVDVVVMSADDPTHEGLAHGHPFGGIAAIEDHGNMTASQIWALGLQFDDLLSNPLRFC